MLTNKIIRELTATAEGKQTRFVSVYGLLACYAREQEFSCHVLREGGC